MISTSTFERRAFRIWGLIAALSLVSLCAQAQETGKRRVVDRASPAYPALARRMALEGVVKVDALVAQDGTVKSAEIKGGSPVLTEAALDAVRRWKWEPAARESHEIVEVKFTPPR